MISISVARRGTAVAGVTVEGHSGLAEAGKDILCAAVSAAIQLTECQLADILGLALQVDVNEAAARVAVTVKNARDLEAAQPPLLALLRTVERWRAEYPKNIEITEGSLS